MAYILKDPQGNIVAASASQKLDDNWIEVAADDKQYLAYLEQAITEGDSFRQSDIHLARVLEDLITLLVERNTIRFTDLPEAAQKRLNLRQSMRKNTRLSGILDESERIY